MLSQYLEDVDNFDSISQSSESTQASEFVAQRIAKYNTELISEPQTTHAESIQVVNIHVRALNVYGDNEGGFSS